MKINGSLAFDASSASEIQNLRVQKLAGESIPVYSAADAGRMVYATTTGGGYTANTLYYGSAGSSSWVAIATGGNAAALQTEVDAIETSLGAIVNSAGQWQVGTITGGGLTGTETSLTAVLNAMAAYANANNELAELDDVTLSTPTTGQVLQKSAGNWVNHTLVLADIPEVTATAAEVNLALDGILASAAELNILDGVTGVSAADITSIGGYAAQLVSATEFGYVNGVTSPIQTQLNALQAGDPTLAALAALDGTAGILVQTGVDTFAKRTLIAPAAGISITDGVDVGTVDGAAGNFTFSLTNDLAALEGLTTTGYIVRTADGAATTRLFTGTAGQVVVTAGDGLASNTDIGLATVTNSNSGTFLKLATDAYGRVTGTTAVTTGDITTLVDTTYVNISGDTMTGNLVMGTNFVTMNDAPTLDTHAANKAYVDSVAAGLSWKNAVVAASTGPLTLASTTVVDGVTLVSGDRVLVKNQTAAAENGIYTFNGTGLVRATDMNAPAEFAGATVFVTGGSTNADSGWTQTSEVVTVGTTAVSFSQFSGSSTYTWGDGLASTGNTIYVNMGAGITMLPSDEVGIDVVSNLALQLQGTNSGDKLTFVLDANSGLIQSASGLKINTASVTNAMLTNPSITFNGDSGSDAVALGETLQVYGTSIQGITTAVSANNITLSALNASAAQKGVASFDATEFTVTDGNVVIGQISNAKLTNANWTVGGTAGTPDAINLGETLNFLNGNSHAVAARLVETTVSANTVTIALRQATATLLGVASFDGNHFAVTAGAVSLDASIGDLNNVGAGADSATAEDVLSFVGGEWVPVTRAAVIGSVGLDALSDVTLTSPAAGDILVRNGSGQFVNKKAYYLHTEGTAATTWTVSHGLGQKYCNVTIVDAGDEVVIPQSITFNSTTQLTVVFNTAIAGRVVVMGIA